METKEKKRKYIETESCNYICGLNEKDAHLRMLDSSYERWGAVLIDYVGASHEISNHISGMTWSKFYCIFVLFKVHFQTSSTDWNKQC